MCRSMVDIQSATTAIRRGKNQEERKKRNKTTMWPVPNVIAAVPNIGGALCSTPQSLDNAGLLKCRAVMLPRRETR